MKKRLWRIVFIKIKIKTIWGSIVANSILRALSCRIQIVFCSLFCASSSFAMVNNDEFRISLVNSLSENSEIIRFYQDKGFQPLWVGNDRKTRERRLYFFKELKNASKHVLPALRYDLDYLKRQARSAKTSSDLGLTEALITLKFIDYSSNCLLYTSPSPRD